MHTYDRQVASHYAAYRPPLHKLILHDILNDHRFGNGLDVGCGTGYSAIALAEKCDRVVAIDHSSDMLDLASPHHNVTYIHGSGDDLPVQAASIDVVTFAGVLPYLNAEAVISELQRVCRDEALIVVYDFEVILDELMHLFSLTGPPVIEAYDHACNLSGHEEVSTVDSTTYMTELNISEQGAAHILLSDKSRYDPLAVQLQATDPFEVVVETLEQSDWPGLLKARIFYSLHGLTG